MTSERIPESFINDLSDYYETALTYTTTIIMLLSQDEHEISTIVRMSSSTEVKPSLCILIQHACNQKQMYCRIGEIQRPRYSTRWPVNLPFSPEYLGEYLVVFCRILWRLVTIMCSLSRTRINLACIPT